MKRNLSDCQSLLPLLRALFCLFLFLGAVSPAHAFYNPVVSSGQDPSVVFVNGYYYLAQTGPGNRIVVIKSSTLTSIASGTRTQVWTAPAGAYCCEIWAPEIQYINNRFYIYFAADDGNNANHRMYVIESNGADAQGAYTFRGKLTPPTDRWAIDGSVLQRGTQLYFVWSGWDGTVNDAQHLFIAPMSNPYTISGERVKISSPDQAWERVVGNPFINEGPQPLLRNGKMFIVYSANGSWADQYCLGMLTASDTANPLLKASWTKSSSCVFSQRDTAYGPGHNSFTKSPNGAEDWIVYHANLAAGSGWGGRSVRIQKFTWNSSGNPVFGTPASRNDDLAQPAGEAPLPAPTQWEASNVAGNFIRHYAGRVRLDPNVSPVQDSQWRMVPGLSNSTGVSFQSVNFPGNYLRHRNGEVWAEAIDGSAGFRADATFFRRAGLANSAYASFEASNFAGSYLRHRGGLFYSEGVADAVGRSDATFIQRGGVSVGVIFYQDINYGGTASALLGKGDYGNLPASVPNDWMSSLRVPAGWAVDAYENGNFTGAICTFAADTAWVGTACNDKMSSVRIR